MKLNKIFWATCMLGGTLALSSCETYDELFPQQYHCVLNIKDAGIRNAELYTTDAEGKIQISIMKTGSQGEALANGMLVPMSEEAFQAYCTDNNLGYAYLPAEYYSLPDKELKFGAQERYKIVEAILKTREIQKLQETHNGQKYALPLLIRSSEVSVNDSMLIIAPDIKSPTIGLTNTGFVSSAQFSSHGEATLTYSLQLTLPTPNTWGLKCTVASNEEAVSAFNQYNTQHNNRYKLLPQNAYTLPDNGVVTFGEEATTASLDITFNRSALEMGEYILPLSITNPTVEGVEIDAAQHTILLGITYSPDKLELKANQFSTNSIANGDGTGLTGLIDGIGSGLHFHSNWNSPVKDATYGNYIDVHLNQPIQAIQFDYWTRFENGNAAPTHIKLFTSTDGKVWTELGEIKSGLPTGGNQKYSSSIYRTANKFSYFRFAVLTSTAGSMTNGSSWFNLGELTLYGN